MCAFSSQELRIGMRTSSYIAYYRQLSLAGSQWLYLLVLGSQRKFAKVIQHWSSSTANIRYALAFLPCEHLSGSAISRCADGPVRSSSEATVYCWTITSTAWEELTKLDLGRSPSTVTSKISTWALFILTQTNTHQLRTHGPLDCFAFRNVRKLTLKSVVTARLAPLWLFHWVRCRLRIMLTQLNWTELRNISSEK